MCNAPVSISNLSAPRRSEGILDEATVGGLSYKFCSDIFSYLMIVSFFVALSVLVLIAGYSQLFVGLVETLFQWSFIVLVQEELIVVN